MGSVAGLVGRRAELTALRSAVDKGARGTGAAVVVLGEAGIGKSRLLEAAVDRARAAGMAVLTGRATASHTGVENGMMVGDARLRRAAGP